MISFIADLENYTPKNQYSDFIKQYFVDIVKYGTKKYISNIDTHVKILEVNDTLIPITFWNNKKQQCFTASVWWMFQYLLLENRKTKSFFIKHIINLFWLVMIRIINYSKIYDTIFVNNLMLSTSIYPDLTQKDFSDIIYFLRRKYKNKSIIFKNINETNHAHIEYLNNLWWLKIVYRQVYLSYSERYDKYKKIKEYKWDASRYKKSEYNLKIVRRMDANISLQMKKCYDNLYIKKYSDMNPNLTKDFFKLIHKNTYFTLCALHNKAWEINGVYSYYNINKQTTAPIIWYKKENLYRHLTHCYINSVLQNQTVLNWSSWVWQFKVYRWAEKATEFFFIFQSYWNIFQAIVWRTIYIISRYVWEPYFKKNII